MHCWWIDPLSYGNRKLPHRRYPPKYLEIGELKQLTNVIYFKVDMDDLMAMTKRISILKHDYKIVHTDVLRIDHEQLKNQDNLLDKMYKPTIKESGPLIHLVTGGDVYYDILVDPNNNSANTENLENTPPEQFTDEEEDQQWIRVLLVRGDLLVIPRNQIFRSTTTGTDFVRIKRFHQQRS